MIAGEPGTKTIFTYEKKKQFSISKMEIILAIVALKISKYLVQIFHFLLKPGRATHIFKFIKCRKSPCSYPLILLYTAFRLPFL